MLKLVIADDEKIIRETIRSFIDWQSIGIEVVGTCSNGVEAYETTLGYYPDTVPTDIKMPGFSGLELVKKIKEIDSNIQLIILSGYDSFEYAKGAMQFGIHHYLLKPRNEHQVIDAINAVRKGCYKQRSLLAMQKRQEDNEKNLTQNVTKSLIFEYISSKSSMPSLTKNYEQLLDFSYTEYKLYYTSYLEEKYLGDCLEQLSAYSKSNFPSLPVHMIYVKNTSTFFSKGCASTYTGLNGYIHGFGFKEQLVSIEFKPYSFLNLGALLSSLTPRLKRHEQINLIKHFRFTQLVNYTALSEKTEYFVSRIFQDNPDETVAQDLYDLFSSIQDTAFLKALITDMSFRLLTTSHQTFISSKQTSPYIENVNHYKNPQELMHYFSGQLDGIMQSGKRGTSSSRNFIFKVISLVDEYLSNPDPSLKWITEDHLYVNVGYLSKQFVKQTGVKFSPHLTSKRMEKAKELLLNGSSEKISEVAEQVGCGDSPQYFSQLSKKYAGMTPSAYLKHHVL